MRLKLAALLLLLPGMGFGAAGHLVLDGILKVKGMSMAGARMVMVDHQGSSIVMDRGLEHFTLTLDLNSEYLMEFTHPGCVTKQVFVDTRVPSGDAIFRDHFFPFQVTLQAPAPDGPFAYDGPVANVHFVAGINDFGYDTDYRGRPMPRLKEAMDTERDRLAGRVPVVVQPSVAPVMALSVDRADVVAPLDPRRTPLRTATLPEPALRKGRVPRIAVAVDRPSPARLEVVRPAAPVNAPVVREAPVLLDDLREDAVVVEPLRVIRIVRIRAHGSVTEYRRVTHRYGQVTHFRNGQACSALEFEQAVGER